MSLPSIEALTAGKRFSASVAALTKNDMKPRRTPLWVFSNRSLYFERRAMTSVMSTSLKVVSMAMFDWASTRRSAILARRRVIGTRFSVRSPAAVTTGAAAAAAGLATAAGADFLLATAATTSSLVTRPPLPVPATVARSMPFSSASLRAAGAATGSSSPASAAAAAGAAAAAAAAGAAAAPPSTIEPRTSSDRTVSPSPLTMSPSTPSAVARTSRTTLSVSMSTISSSRLTASPGFLCQVATVPSATDSGKVGALISIAIISVSLNSVSGARRR
ncbi:hypothetical protein D3C81_1068890 [compost metagenome]